MPARRRNRKLFGFFQVCNLTSTRFDIGLFRRRDACQRLRHQAKASFLQTDLWSHLRHVRGRAAFVDDGLLRLHPRKGKPVARLARKAQGRIASIVLKTRWAVRKPGCRKDVGCRSLPRSTDAKRWWEWPRRQMSGYFPGQLEVESAQIVWFLVRPQDGERQATGTRKGSGRRRRSAIGSN